MNQKMGLQGRYTIRVTRPGVGVIRELEFDNLITDLGLNGIGINGASWVASVSLGTGTAAPAAGDTTISGAVSTTGTTPNGWSGGWLQGVVNTGSPRYSWGRVSRRFAQGVAEGNWTEVGIGRSSTALWSRALILDGLGDPTTLSIAAIDIVDVEYELRVYPSEVDVTGNKTIGGVDTAYTIRPTQLDAVTAQRMLTGSWMSIGSAGYGTYVRDGALNDIWLLPSGNQLPSYSSGGSWTSNSVAAYVNGSRTKVVTTNGGIDSVNLASGISVAIPYFFGDGFNGGVSPFKCGFSPPIAKNNTKIISLTFSVTWGRL